MQSAIGAALDLVSCELLDELISPCAHAYCRIGHVDVLNSVRIVGDKAAHFVGSVVIGKEPERLGREHYRVAGQAVVSRYRGDIAFGFQKRAARFLADKRRVGRQDKQPARLDAELFNAEQDGIEHIGLAEMAVRRDGHAVVLKMLLNDAVLISDHNGDLVHRNGVERVYLIREHTFSADMDKRLRSFYIRGLACCQYYCCGFHSAPPDNTM